MKTIMYLQTKRIVFAFSMALALTACGARSTNEYGLEESTGVMLVGERLEGLRIEIDDVYNRTITSDEITRTLGAWTARRNKEEKMQRTLIEIASGRHGLKVFSDGVLILEKEVYLSDGQRLEVSVP